MVIPTHRRPELLARALASVLCQTYVDFEVIVVDDSGRDSEEQIATQTHVCSEVQDRRVHYLVNGTSQGGAEARNIGIRQARGELVAFLDDDEDWLPEKLAKQIAAIDKASPDTGVVDTGFYDWKRNGQCRTAIPKMQGWIFEKLLSKTGGRAPKLSTLLCRKDALLECGLFDPSLKARQDYDLYIRLSRKWQFTSVMEPLSNKRADADGRITGNINNFVQGYGAIHAKLRDDFAIRPGIHAIYLLKYAEVLARAGLGAEARQRYWQAARLRPLNPRLITYGYKIFVGSRD
ncbi:glycosyltransferase family 2 protein [Aquisalimonas sp. APHAB1-3]|uniref:glycosyltransferase family 2 protein n=1 Tax=Aquisalimonas sp. APHAB1-3 TaxID=3402080 RepID=UPI003AAC3AF4